MIDLQELLYYCQAEAIANKMNPNEASVYRSICRSYSEKFHTPLTLVMELDPEHVILNVYESQAEDMKIDDYQRLESIMDTLLMMEDPNYEAKKKDKQAEYDRQAELEEEERIKSGKAVHPSLQKDLNRKKISGNSEEPEEKKPTGGSVNLDYLSRQDSEG